MPLPPGAARHGALASCPLLLCGPLAAAPSNALYDPYRAADDDREDIKGDEEGPRLDHLNGLGVDRARIAARGEEDVVDARPRVRAILERGEPRPLKWQRERSERGFY